MSNPDDFAKAIKRITQLEISLMQQQKLVDDLNGVVTQQTLELEKLSRKVKSLSDDQNRLRNTLDATMGGDIPNERPPHY